MKYYPVFLHLKGRKCLVIGSGELAEQKAAVLESSGAVVERQERFDPAQAEDTFLIVAVVEDRAEARRIKAFADQNRVLLNVVDQAENSSFIAPAIVDRGDLLIAISTSGKSPALARKIRQQLEEQFGTEYAEIAHALGEIRPLVRERFPSFEDRKHIYKKLVDLVINQK